MVNAVVVATLLFGGLLITADEDARVQRSAPICGNCKSISNPQDCRLFKQCHHHQVCETERVGNHYNLQCADRDKCQAILHEKNNRERFLFTLYSNMDCCSDAFCNTHLFKEDFTTTEAATTTTMTTTTGVPCFDKVGMNCKQKEVDICKSVNVGQKYCPKTCKLC
ncbi:uncharacterized protein LOC124115780 [Haliotis rufescens]|uniref:uncharacterized protein LOC124115780 n=1 Tax=Haliotis rufescens TaxID=6454 RepID=UPI00201E7E86|nr:uncharacterized protein LOC124115780 [Haliotis rufescens]